MNPVVAEVVLVDEPLAGPEPEVAQSHPLGVAGGPRPGVSGVLVSVDEEAVSGLTRPAEARLDRLVEIGERAPSRNEEAPPNQRADPPEHDAELVDGHGR